jgi:hypothetical protein
MFCCLIIGISYSQALKQLPREKIQLATKFGVFRLQGDQHGQFGVRGTPEYVRECCEASLKRLDVDYIDLYYSHRIDVNVPIEDTVSIKILFPPFTYYIYMPLPIHYFHVQDNVHSILVPILFGYIL